MAKKKPAGRRGKATARRSHSRTTGSGDFESLSSSFLKPLVTFFLLKDAYCAQDLVRAVCQVDRVKDGKMR